MIIRFIKNLGNYQEGKIHVCKSESDKQKARELIKWGFAQEVSSISEYNQSFNESVSFNENTKGNKEYFDQSTIQERTIWEEKMEDQKQLKLAFKKLKEDRERMIKLLQKNLSLLKDQLKRKDDYIQNKDKQIGILTEGIEKLQSVDELRLRETEKKEKLKNRILDLKRKLESLNEEKEKVINFLSSEIDTLRNNFNDQIEKSRELNEEIRDLKSYSQRLKDEVQSREERILSLEKEIKDLDNLKDGKITLLEERIEISENENKEKNEQISELNLKIEELEQETENYRKNKEEIGIIKRRMNDLVNEKERTIIELKDTITSIKEQLLDREERIESLNKEVKGLQILESFNLKKYEKEQEKKNEKIIYQENRLRELESEKEKTFSLFKDNLRALEDQLEKKDQQIDNLDSQVNSLNQEIRRIRQNQNINIGNRDRENNTFQDERKKLLQRIQVLKEIKEKSDKNVEMLREDLNKKDQKIAYLEQQIKKYLETNIQFEEQNDDDKPLNGGINNTEANKAIESPNEEFLPRDRSKKRDHSRNSTFSERNGESDYAKLSDVEEQIRELSAGIIMDHKNNNKDNQGASRHKVGGQRDLYATYKKSKLSDIYTSDPFPASGVSVSSIDGDCNENSRLRYL